ncbi:MAG: SPOR domain-containing protein [Pseudomonadota bacterium]
MNRTPGIASDNDPRQTVRAPSKWSGGPALVTLGLLVTTAQIAALTAAMSPWPPAVQPADTERVEIHAPRREPFYPVSPLGDAIADIRPAVIAPLPPHAEPDLQYEQLVANDPLTPDLVRARKPTDAGADGLPSQRLRQSDRMANDSVAPESWPRPRPRPVGLGTTTAFQRSASTVEPQPTAAPVGGPSGQNWWAYQPGDHFTLQLVSMRNAERVRKLASELTAYPRLAELTLKRGERVQHVLVQGTYRNAAAAAGIAKELARKTGEQPWLRRFSELRRALSNDA